MAEFNSMVKMVDISRTTIVNGGYFMVYGLTMVYGRYNYSIHGGYFMVYKPTNIHITGFPHPAACWGTGWGRCWCSTDFDSVAWHPSAYAEGAKRLKRCFFFAAKVRRMKYVVSIRWTLLIVVDILYILCWYMVRWHIQIDMFNQLDIK